VGAADYFSSAYQQLKHKVKKRLKTQPSWHEISLQKQNTTQKHIEIDF